MIKLIVILFLELVFLTLQGCGSNPPKQEEVVYSNTAYISGGSSGPLVNVYVEKQSPAPAVAATYSQHREYPSKPYRAPYAAQTAQGYHHTGYQPAANTARNVQHHQSQQTDHHSHSA